MEQAASFAARIPDDGLAYFVYRHPTLFAGFANALGRGEVRLPSAEAYHVNALFLIAAALALTARVADSSNCWTRCDKTITSFSCYGIAPLATVQVGPAH